MSSSQVLDLGVSRPHKQSSSFLLTNATIYFHQEPCLLKGKTIKHSNIKKYVQEMQETNPTWQHIDLFAHCLDTFSSGLHDISLGVSLSRKFSLS